MASPGTWSGTCGRAILAALLVLGAMAAPAAASGIYTVVVSVPLASADDPAARGAAEQAAREAALDRVLRRLTAVRSHRALPQATGPNVAGYVESLAVLDIADGAMRARVALRADAVRRLLEGLGIEHLSDPGPQLVVVPVYAAAGGDAVLWSGPNPWLDAWAARAGDASLVPIVAPYGEFGDLQAITTAEAVDGDGPPLASLAARYEADGAVVAIYSPQAAGGETQVRISVVALPDWTGTDTVSVPFGSPIPAEAVDRVMEAIDRMWIERQIRPSYDGPVSSLELTAVFASLQDWIEIRHVLADAPVIERFDVPMVTGQQARVLLRHYASLATLQADLAAAGVILEQGTQFSATGSGLILRLANAPSPGAQPGFATAAPGFAPTGTQPQSPWAPQPPAPPQPMQPMTQPTNQPTIAPTIPTLRYEP